MMFNWVTYILTEQDLIKKKKKKTKKKTKKKQTQKNAQKKFALVCTSDTFL